MKWQPIETAPYNKEVLVFGKWRSEITGLSEYPEYVCAIRDEDDDGKWIMNCAGYECWVEATHWMPLPEKPNETN